MTTVIDINLDIYTLIQVPFTFIYVSVSYLLLFRFHIDFSNIKHCFNNIFLGFMSAVIHKKDLKILDKVYEKSYGLNRRTQ